MALALFVSCDKHEILYNTEPVGDKAEIQIHYFEPVAAAAANYIDSVYINNTLYSSVLGSGQLLTYNGVPGGSAGRFFAVKAGEANIKFYRRDVIVYDVNVNLQSGKQNVFIHDLKKAPIVINNGYPYREMPTTSVANWDTDSLVTVGFYNFLYETAGVPYSGKIQYQYQDYRTKEWKNVGKAVAFGEFSGRELIVVVKETFNSQGARRVDYRMLDDAGEILRVMNSSGGMVNYSDWWTATIGRHYMHIYGGFRVATPVAAIRVWTSN